MSQDKNIEKFALPEGVTATVDKGIITLKGTKGEVSKSFFHPKVIIAIEGNEITLTTERFFKNDKKLIKTYLSHLKNLAKGVTEGHIYKLKICSGHFPMNVSVKGNKMEIKNFIGEAVPRKLQFKEGVNVKLEGDLITVTGIDKELTSQAAASIEQTTRRNGFDRRIFQDGIYIIEKDGKQL